jgi:polysaccharide biosynthesis/export protein
MESGTSSYTCRGRAFLVELVAFALMVGGGFAQQAASGGQAGQNSDQSSAPAQPPSALPVQPAVQPAMQPGQSAAQSTVTVSATPSGAHAAETANPAADQGTVKLGPGDLIELSVYNVPELTTKARIGSSGDVYLPLVDYVHIAGLTLEEAQTVLEKRLEEGGFVRSPHVTIFVDEANSQGVTILGEVGKPGIYADPADRKLYEVISMAGGFTVSASRKIAVIRRNQAEAIHIDLPRNLSDDLSGNIDVLPGDTINVPRAPIIYVVGDVGRPSGLLVDNGSLTVLQALALAGGTNHTAKMGGVRIIRKTPAGMTETHVALKKMLEAKSPDVTLQADDILFVPLSGVRVAASRTFEAAISAATAVSVYAVHP